LGLVSRLDPAAKEWIELISSTLTALGTLAAVVVALYLASRERRDKIRARARERAILNHPKQPNDPLPVINIEVTNLSLHPVTITSFGWTVGVLCKQHFVQVPDWTDPLTFKLPTRLEYGESARCNFPREEFFKNVGDICRNISTVIPWVSARFIFLVVITSGYPGEFRFRVEPSLGRALVNRAQEIKASTTSPEHHKPA
jgi:hypothetical protein